ncbi:thymidine phosphorylase [Saccharata proteae CBS 121410]|uniref:Thymidine phosphorylase n=1 Tax=Saccharata proteae CBS 121410 TaxID=1314787 RepID=A0A9P4LUT5_9PEZI|nr:thymidine phosphorylase [Saccharata proteae CBS 121410]
MSTTYLPQETIRRKRDGLALAPHEIHSFISSISTSRVSEGQIAAFAMAIYLRGMTLAERTALTLSLRDSGVVLTWPAHIPGPIVDKHSTGGVGDYVSLPLAPLLACCGCYVPMISGRGLGHTGGTLDKLSSIPGYNLVPTPTQFSDVVSTVGCAIIGQTAALAPADKTLYAIRDVTATVESIDLITASILAKKLAAGLDVLIMDVKTGNGAFMATTPAAVDLATSIVAVANAAGVKTRALVTDMNAPLARAAGNALEVADAVALLNGQVRSPRLWETTLAIGEAALVEGGLAADRAAAREALLRAWKSGAAATKFGDMVAALGGPPDFMERSEAYLPVAPVVLDVFFVPADGVLADGVVTAVDTRAVGLAVVALGGGRTTPSDEVDTAVGFSALRFPGEAVGKGSPLGVVHARTEAKAEEGARALRAAYTVGRVEDAAGLVVRDVVIERL